MSDYRIGMTRAQLEIVDEFEKSLWWIDMSINDGLVAYEMERISIFIALMREFEE